MENNGKIPDYARRASAGFARVFRRAEEQEKMRRADAGTRLRLKIVLAVLILLNIAGACLLFAIERYPEKFRHKEDGGQRLLQGRVERVIDGDTVAVTAGGGREVVRIAGIDAPEKKQPLGREAAEFLSSLVLGREVDLWWNWRDQYGRIIGEIRLPDGTDAGYAMLEKGLALHYLQHNKDPDYADAQQRAILRGLGFWGLPVELREDPWDWRLKHNDKSNKYIRKHK